MRTPYYCPLLSLQACTEMMLPSDTNHVTDMFPPHHFDPSQHCMDKFGVKYRNGWMKTQYWGKGIGSQYIIGARYEVWGHSTQYWGKVVHNEDTV